MLKANVEPGVHWQRGHHQHQITLHGSVQPGSSRHRFQSQTVRQRRATTAAASSVSGDGSVTGAQAVLDRYRAMLHEYRQHKSALGDWFARTTAAQARPPQLLDAEATGDAALVSRFQQYLMVRKRLLAEIPLIRDQLEQALEQQQPHPSSSSSNSGPKHGKSSSRSDSQGVYGVVNANKTSPVSKSQAVGQFFAAVNYRKQHRPSPSSSSSSSSNESSTVAPANFAAPAVTAAAGQNMPEQLTVATANPHAATAAAAADGADAPAVAGEDAGSSSSGSNGVAASSSGGDTVSHLLAAATSSTSSTPSSSRAASAALAALAYKKRKQSGVGSDSSSSSSSSSISQQQQQRPIAVLQAAPPPPPPGYAADGSNNASASGSAGVNVVIGVVETGKGDVNALRSKRQLDADVSLEATLQGVPGGLGSGLNAPIFATAITAQGSTAAAGANSVFDSSSSSSMTTTAATGATVASSGNISAEAAAAAARLAAAEAAAAAARAPVGEVVTAKFDVYSGRQRKLDPNAQLDDYFSSLAEAYSTQLAAAVAAAGTTTTTTTTSSSSSSRSSSTSSIKDAAAAVSANSKAAGKGVRQAGVCGGNSSSGNGSGADGGLLVQEMTLPADIVPLPT